jgi:PilZ domain
MKGKPSTPNEPPGERPVHARRRFPRYPLDIRVSVRALRSGDAVSLWGRSNEMGKDGIGVTLTGQLNTGEVVSLELTLPRSSYPIKIRALVRYRDGLRHGFEFLTLTTQQREMVDRACETLAAQDG